ncbi:MAG: hypothetical protein ONB15_12090, partial [candidate division KSB1 bacterium]|nr:hypothetical protein [candidate division KSB1 bacterium]
PRQVRDVADMYRRLEVVQLQLEEHGLTHEKNYEMMLRRLSNGQDPAPLRTLVDVLEPVKGYARGRSRRYTSFSPLTRVVDTARPDPLTVRRFRAAVQNFLANRDQTSMNTMRNMLCLWRDNHARLLPVLRSSPIIQEVEPLSADMARVATIGLQALEYLTHGQFSASWQEKALADLEECRAPRAEAELMIVGPVEELVRACGPQGPRSGK